MGDKTFLIAAILAMRHPTGTVFMGAFSALALMSVLSALLGVVFPALLPKALTTFCAGALFVFFGIKMIREALRMDGSEMNDEWKEAAMELDAEEYTMDDLENGNGAPAPPKASAAANFGGVREGARNLLSLCFSQTFAQAFVLTFLGEWGDRSQIATIAMAAAHVRTAARSAHPALADTWCGGCLNRTSGSSASVQLPDMQSAPRPPSLPVAGSLRTSLCDKV